MHKHVGELELDTDLRIHAQNGSSDNATYCRPSATGAETRSTPRGWAARSRAAATLDSIREKHSLVSSTSCCPTCVRRTDRVVRCNRAAPTVRSSSLTRWLTAAFDTPSWRAAVVKLPHRATAVSACTRDQTRSLRKTSSPEATDTSLLFTTVNGIVTQAYPLRSACA